MKKMSDLCSVIVFFTAMLLCIARPSQISVLTCEALELCAKRIFPSLFLFSVITQLLTRFGIAMRAGYALSFVITPLTGIPKELCGAFLTGMFGGFPNGAHACGIVYSKGLCSKKEAELCVALSNNGSLAFLLTFAGATATGSLKNGMILEASQLISVFIISLIFRISDKKQTVSCTAKTISKNSENAFTEICRSITAACTTMINVCGFITVFYILSGFISSHFEIHRTLVSVVKGIFEISSGIASVNSIAFPDNMIICSVILGFSGLSVILQVTDACSKYGLSARKFIYSRFYSAVLMPVITSFLLMLLPHDCIGVFSYSYNANQANLSITSALILYAVIFASVMCFFAVLYTVVYIFDKKSENANIMIV